MAERERANAALERALEAEARLETGMIAGRAGVEGVAGLPGPAEGAMSGDAWLVVSFGFNAVAFALLGLAGVPPAPTMHDTALAMASAALALAAPP